MFRQNEKLKYNFFNISLTNTFTVMQNVQNCCFYFSFVKYKLQFINQAQFQFVNLKRKNQ